MTDRKKKPTWSDLKRWLAELDCPALRNLIQDLYAVSKENQTFLHTRFALGEDILEPYKATIDRWVCPDVLRNQDISVAKAKKAISDYRKASGRPNRLRKNSFQASPKLDLESKPDVKKEQDAQKGFQQGPRERSPRSVL